MDPGSAKTRWETRFAFAIGGLAVDKQGRWVVSSQDMAIKVWLDPRTGKILFGEDTGKRSPREPTILRQPKPAPADSTAAAREREARKLLRAAERTLARAAKAVKRGHVEMALKPCAEVRMYAERLAKLGRAAEAQRLLKGVAKLGAELKRCRPAESRPLRPRTARCSSEE